MITHLGLDVGTSKIAAAFYDPQLTPAQGGAIQLFSLGDRGVISTQTLLNPNTGEVILGSVAKASQHQVALDSEKSFLGLFEEESRRKNRREEWLRAKHMQSIGRANMIGPTESQFTFFTAKARGPKHQMQLRPYRLLAVRILGVLQSIGYWEQREQGQYKGIPQDHLLPELRYVGLSVPLNFDKGCRGDLLNAVRLALLMLWSTYHTSQTTRDTLKTAIKENADLDLEVYGILEQVFQSTQDLQRDIDSLVHRLDTVEIQILEEPVASFCSFLYENANAREQLGLPRRGNVSQPEGTSHVAVLDGGAGTCDLILLRMKHQLLSAADDRFDPHILLELFPVDANRELSMPGMHHLDRLFAKRCFEDGPLGLPFWLIDQMRDVFSRRLFSEELTEEQMDPLLLDDIDLWLVSLLRDEGENALWSTLVRNTLCNLQQGVVLDKPEIYHWRSDSDLPPINPLLWDQADDRIRSLRSHNIERRIRQWGWMTSGTLGPRVLGLLQRWMRMLYDSDNILSKAREDFIMAMASWIAEVRYQIANVQQAVVAQQDSGRPRRGADGTIMMPSRRPKTPPPPPKKQLKPEDFVTDRYSLEFDVLGEDTLPQVCKKEIDKLEVSCEIKRFEFDQYGGGMQFPVLISGGIYHYKSIWERLAGPLLRNAAGERSAPLRRYEHCRPELDVALGSCWAGVDLGEGYEKRFFFRPEQNIQLYIGAPTQRHNPQYMVASEERQDQFLFWVFSDVEMNQPNFPVPIGEAQPVQGYCVIPYQRETRNLFDQSGKPDGYEGNPALQQQGFPHFQVRVGELRPFWVQIPMHYFDYVMVRRRINPDRSFSLIFTPVLQGQEQPEYEQQIPINFPPYTNLRNLVKVAAVMKWGEPIRAKSYKFFQCMRYQGKEQLYELNWF